jgi:hypothetical protein
MKTYHWFWAILIFSFLGCDSSSNNKNENSKSVSPLFAEGYWVRKPEFDALRYGNLKIDYFWRFNDFVFTTDRKGENPPTIECPPLDMSGELTACDSSWCLTDQVVASFLILADDTLAHFPDDIIGDGAPYISILPPDLSVNNNPDWAWRKYYFNWTYVCQPAGDEPSFNLRMDENGLVHNHPQWKRYFFHCEHEAPLLGFFDDKGKEDLFVFLTRPDANFSFSLHKILNLEEVSDGEGGQVEVGGKIFDFVVE